MPFQPWEYRTETGFTGDDVDLTGIRSKRSTATSVTLTTQPMSCSGRRTWWLIPGRGSSAARCCCRPGWSSGSTPSRKGVRGPDQGPNQSAPEYDQTVDDAQYRALWVTT